MKCISRQLAITASFMLLSMFPALSKGQNNAPDTAQGQTETRPAQHGDRGAFLANLNLTDDQKAQIKQIREGARSQVDAVKNDSSLSTEQKEAKVRDIRHDSHEQVKKVLTPEQRKQMHENRREHREIKQHQAPPPSN
jgi:Spy/CpxP family protein refolding chaperone